MFPSPNFNLTTQPAWFIEARKKAFERMSVLGLPKKDEESWRKISLQSIPIQNLSQPADSAIFLNRDENSNDKTLSTFSMTECDNEKQEILSFIEPLFDKGNFFQLASVAYCQNFVFIRSKKGEKSGIHVSHQKKSGITLAHLVFIVAEESSELTLHEGNETKDESLLLCISFVRGERNSKVNVISRRSLSDDTFHFIDLIAEQKADSRISYGIAHTGGRLGKNFIISTLSEKNSFFKGTGITTLRGNSFLDVEMKMLHIADHSGSDLLYKTVLTGSAHSIFNGSLSIPKGVKHVDSIEVNRNIVMSKKARAESMPKLLIQAQDVRCEHGSTVGDLDEDSIYFLMTRGLSEDDARELLIRGFIAEIIESLPYTEEESEKVSTELAGVVLS